MVLCGNDDCISERCAFAKRKLYFCTEAAEKAGRERIGALWLKRDRACRI